MPEALAELPVVRGGSGPALLLVHGSAADHTTWMAQLSMPPRGLSFIAYDRRGSGSVPFPDGVAPSTEVHVEDAARLIRREAGGRPLLVCGSSYGAVVALGLASRAPELVAGLILCEPPMPAPWMPSTPSGFGCAFDRVAATASGEAAAELFLRLVLGEKGFEFIPRTLRSPLFGKWRQIRADMIALARTRLPRADDLAAAVPQPCLLVGGADSPPYYGIALDALAQLLPGARRATIPEAGHAMHFENYAVFHQAVVSFARAIGYLTAP